MKTEQSLVPISANYGRPGREWQESQRRAEAVVAAESRLTAGAAQR